jgi:hypothetical protein
MTVLEATPAATIRPVAVRQLAWVSWRRNRASVLGLGSFLAALATYLLVTGLKAHAAYDDLGSCVPPITSDACRIQWDAFTNAHSGRGLTAPLLLILPGIIGAVIGAPLIGRELESGVFRYSWTQGAGRMRWAVATIIPVGLLSSALMGAMGVLVTWRNEPMVHGGAAQRFDSSTFPTTGVAAVGWTLLAFSSGVLAGLLWRRVVPAVATSFVLWFGLAFVASLLRPHLMTPLTTTGELPSGAMQVSEQWTKDGQSVSVSEVSSILAKVGVTMTDHGVAAHAGPGSAAPPDPFKYLTSEGYHQEFTYQPDHRFWPFQWIETGALVLVSAGLIGLSLGLVRRRST